MHEYTHALVGKVTLTGTSDRAEINEARRQHDCYLRLLRELNLKVVEVEFIERADILIEDLAIVCNGTALLATPTSDSDLQNYHLMKEVLSEEVGQNVVEIHDPAAKVMGSDVLFTGQEFFVGVGRTTNEAGAAAVAAAFPEFPCTPIKLTKPAKHLKSYITVAGHGILCIGASKDAQQLLKRIEKESSFGYQTLTVPEDHAANCLFINGTMIHRAIEEIPDSFGVFCEKIDFKRRSICFVELAKISCGLTSYSLLVKQS